ncbi:hypothetical protein LTR96_004319 [Exophiala xenobiotica]|nr:hypothetical protein LTR92_004236 [Exophiala xenobiotica]KAK5227358.1 hypothetical protein LTR72_003348 [Exophiala xenobiotica]KAK5271041.1 hypothetical protein LTR96_004319 [Exophiala xenobiotica]KAK5301106.1 hypothetical protein LTR14_001504 [Exophiala xenobiotica]KAK5339932.1 hypothetical protein LTR98_004734 [Exophiala xenobiotica]
MSRRAPADRAAQNAQTLKALVKLEGNKVCADCKRNKHPRWASWNLGVFICIRCSGIHRGMGTHISRVKSVDLDAWTDEQLQNILKWGNSRANKYYEAKLAPGHVPSEAKIENFIRTKYDSKRWVMDGPMPDPSTLDDGEDDMPLNIVQEKAKMERSASQRQAPIPPAPQSRPAANVNLFDDFAPAPPVRPSTADIVETRPTRTGPPAPAPAQAARPASKPQDSLLGLDFFGSTPSAGIGRPSSAAANSTQSSNSRGDLKSSILSLYASAPKPQPAPQPQHDRQPSFGGMTSPPLANQTAFGGLTDAFSGLDFSCPSTTKPPQPQASSAFSAFGNLTSSVQPKAAPSAPQVTSPPPLSGGGFFDTLPSKAPAVKPTVTSPSASGGLDFSFTQKAAAPQPAAAPKPAVTSLAADLFAADDFGGFASSTPVSPPRPAPPMVSSPPVSTANISSPFNLSSPTVSAPKPAPQQAPQAFKSSAMPQNNAALFDPWGSSNDSSPWGAPDPAPAQAAQTKVELGKPPAHITANDIHGGWADPMSSSSRPSQQPTVTADEDFGGWTSASTTQTPIGGAPKPSGGGFGGASDPFDNPWETGASFAARRGHLPQLSISDENHHVTETIGYLYDDDLDQDSHSHYPYSNQHNNFNNQTLANGARTEGNRSLRRTSVPRKQLPGGGSTNENGVARPNGLSRGPSTHSQAWDRNRSSPSPPLGSRERSPSDTATSSFPLNDIDYESSPAGLAQELSNLQALRRMSMSVGATDDPDLPQINAAGMPNAPTPDSSEDDSSRLFWVPARLHPELAPKEFKTFLEGKAEQIRRRSGELSAFTSPSSSRSSSLSAEGQDSGLRRKKSMLSRQINSSVGYQDGAERLERKKSQSRRTAPQDPNLHELETLVANTVGLSKVELETPKEDETGDIILPSVPGSSLKRSTRTTYRRGGSVKGRGADRSTYAQRAARRATAESPSGSRPDSPESAVPTIPPIPSFASVDVSNLAGTLADPSSSAALSKSAAMNFSRPAGRDVSSSTSLSSSVPSAFDSFIRDDDPARRPSTSSLPDLQRPPPAPKSPPPVSAPYERKPVPQIVEVPPPEEPRLAAQAPRSSSIQSAPPATQPPVRHPERVSSREDKVRKISPQRPSMPTKGSQPNITGRPSPSGNSMPPQTRPTQSLEQPSPLPGNDTNTSNLSFIPTLTVDKRADHKKKEEKKSGWGWLLGKEDGEKDKGEKPKAKISKPPQQHDNTRLDVLQTSIDGTSKGRESVVLDRDTLKLEEERKKESQRKSSGSNDKKEKESFLSSIFGGKKAKGEKESSAKKYRERGLSPEPPYRELKADIDYNWTRFSILEERAIYRMAHIKLANPRRALYSQVLLSNFMYSYLAKVQQMHPQMNLPTSAKQQRKQPSKDQQPDEFTQYQRYQQQQAQQQSLEQQPKNGSQQDMSDTSVYEHDSGSDLRPISRGSKSSVEGNGSSSARGGYHQYHSPQQQKQQQQGQYGSQLDDDDDDDMW